MYHHAQLVIDMGNLPKFLPRLAVILLISAFQVAGFIDVYCHT
jgi:hypothetical protein